MIHLRSYCTVLASAAAGDTRRATQSTWRRDTLVGNSGPVCYAYGPIGDDPVGSQPAPAAALRTCALPRPQPHPHAATGQPIRSRSWFRQKLGGASTSEPECHGKRRAMSASAASSSGSFGSSRLQQRSARWRRASITGASGGESEGTYERPMALPSSGLTARSTACSGAARDRSKVARPQEWHASTASTTRAGCPQSVGSHRNRGSDRNHFVCCAAYLRGGPASGAQIEVVSPASAGRRALGECSRSHERRTGGLQRRKPPQSL